MVVTQALGQHPFVGYISKRLNASPIVFERFGKRAV
jgi:hypothetical protein